MKIGLLGGSFNPPHLGHIHISNLAIKKLALNQVWWIPTAQNPFKNSAVYESYENRVAKCRIISKAHPKIYIKEFNDIYTIELITKLKNRYKNIEFFWIMGADNLEKFHKWKNFKQLLKMISFAIFSRGTFLKKVRRTRVFQLKLNQKFQIFQTKNVDISSTQLRK